MRVCSLCIVIIISMITSCDIINPEEEIPTYVFAEGAVLNTSFEEEGTASSQFSDVWAYHNGELLGVYEMPVLIPILNSEKAKRLALYAGIKDNSTSTVRVLYPFLNSVEVTLSGRQAAIDSFSKEEFVFTYRDNTNFVLLESFDRESVAMSPLFQGVTNYAIVRNQTEVFEGEGSLKATLNDESPFFGIQTFNLYQRSDFRQGAPVYVELNYKNEGLLLIGLVVYDFSGIATRLDPFLYLNESDEWKKTYINLGAQIAFLNESERFSIYLGAEKTDSSATSAVYLDNFKIITFE